MLKKLFTFFATAAVASSTFGLGFFVGQQGEPMPENGFKMSTCNWGRSLHYKTDLYKIKPGPADWVNTRGGQIFEIDQNIYVNGLSSIASKLIYAKDRKIKIREDIRQELQTSKIQFENCTVDVGDNFHFAFWEKSQRAGVATLELDDTTMNIGGSIFCLIPVHPDVDLKTTAGPMFVLTGNSKLNVGYGALFDSIFDEKPEVWKIEFKLVGKNDHMPQAYFGNEVKADKVLFDIDVKNLKISKPGTYPIVTLADKNSSFKNARFIVNGRTYSLGDAITVNGKNAKIVMGASPFGKDSKTENDILLIISK